MRHAVLIDGPSFHIDISYGAVPELAPWGYATFEDALASLTLFTPGAL
ncbi:MAG: hypothetical protein HYZ27_05015 [Deltaproteobacteria bacterium]|nr:hypothetical protein [Deltaproteobacteria bacterium]